MPSLEAKEGLSELAEPTQLVSRKGGSVDAGERCTPHAPLVSNVDSLPAMTREWLNLSVFPQLCSPLHTTIGFLARKSSVFAGG